MSFCCTWRILVLFKLLILCSSFFGIHFDFLAYCIKILFSITKCLVSLSPAHKACALAGTQGLRGHPTRGLSAGAEAWWPKQTQKDFQRLVKSCLLGRRGRIVRCVGPAQAVRRGSQVMKRLWLNISIPLCPSTGSCSEKPPVVHKILKTVWVLLRNQLEMPRMKYRINSPTLTTLTPSVHILLLRPALWERHLQVFTHEEGVPPTTQMEVLESSLRSGEGHSATDDFLPDVVPCRPDHKVTSWTAVLFIFKIYLLFFIYLLHCPACEILVPRPGMGPVPPTVEAWSLNHWTAREVPAVLFKKKSVKHPNDCSLVTFVLALAAITK